MAKNRPELDMDIMYSMIMPSAPVNHKKDEVENEPPIQAVEALQPPEPTPPAPLFSPSGVIFSDKEPAVLVNAMEQLVLEKLDAAFGKFNCCKCDRCKKDVAALALNKLTPKYVVADGVYDYAQLAQRMSADVTTAIVQSIIAVRAHPRH